MVNSKMPELISDTRLFLHRTPIEPINYTGELELETANPNKGRKWLKRSLVAAVGYMAFVAVDNATFYIDTARVAADDGEMLYDIKGCKEFPKVTLDPKTNELIFPPEFTEEQAQSTFEIQKDHLDIKSAALNFEPKKFNFLKFVSDWKDITSNKQFSFTSEISGLNVNLYSDTKDNPFLINNFDDTTDAIDELIHATLDESLVYDHVGVAAYIDCLQERFIAEDGPRELEGKSLNIYVPSKPGVCYSNGLVQHFPAGAKYKDFCDSIGGTKEIRIAARPFYVYKQHWMTLMTNSKKPYSAEQNISDRFVHEATHLLMEAAGMPIRLNENEKLAKYLESVVISQLYYDGLPTSIAYPDIAYVFSKNED